MADAKAIAVKLLERTNENKINWRPTASESAFAAVIGDWSVSISISSNMRASSMSLRIHDGTGQLLDGLVAAQADDPATFRQLRELHQKAKRNALGIDSQLEGLLAELERV